MPTILRVDVFSDVICPWCMIGLHRLERAVETMSEDFELELHWLPFELNPDMPAEGMDRRAYLEGKFGPGGADQVYGRIGAALDADGIEADLAAIRRTPSTFRAHRLLALAESQGKGTALKRELFASYFRKGEDIGDDSVLLACAVRAGIDAGEAGPWLETGQGADHVRQLEGEARRLGVQGVPFFILDRRLGMSGAQPVEVMQDALRQALDQLSG